MTNEKTNWLDAERSRFNAEYEERRELAPDFHGPFGDAAEEINNYARDEYAKHPAGRCKPEMLQSLADRKFPKGETVDKSAATSALRADVILRARAARDADDKNNAR